MLSRLSAAPLGAVFLRLAIVPQSDLVKATPAHLA